jgi:hypothetical protein
MLGQTAAGQPMNSPCIDAGDPGSSMITGSTRTDLVQDSDIVDMGFHWWLRSDEISRLNLALLEGTEPPELVQKARMPQGMDLQIGIQPNPFNASTVISYQLSVASFVNLEIYDIVGRLVESPLHEDWQEAGKHEVTWHAAGLPSGVYVVRMVAGDFAAVKKVVILR